MRVNVFWQAKVPAAQKPSSALLTRAVRLALGRANVRGEELSVIFTDKPEIRRLNRRFLSRNRLTDVIAFSYPAYGALGDIYVCAEVAANQAKRLGHSLKKELLLLAAHGALHLSGMHDADAAQRRKMHLAADKIAAKLGFQENL
ncbi:MAG: rRNA maturation RNase YbeY [Elusimicrobiales bacterium]|nr:rRNA maturation RNase YbeY [Elusimicrobiales bacterium]